MIKLSLIIPCYNESKNIPLILEKLNACIKRSDVEVLLVNNGSNDNSQLILEEMIPKYSFAKTVLVEVNKGYGFGILSGLKEATGEYLAWTHADMQTDPYDVIRALEIAEKEDSPKDIYIKGLRKKRPLFDEFFTFGMSLFESVLLRSILWDINAQPNLFHCTFYESWQNPPHDFSLDLFVLYMAKKQNLKIIRFDVVFPPRIHGESSWNTGLHSKWKFIKRTIDFSLKLSKGL